MEDMMKFNCLIDTREDVPMDVLHGIEVSFPKVHSDAEEMVKLGKAFKEYHKLVAVNLPFCMTVEAEALGASVNLGDWKNGPRISNFAFSKLEELEHIKDIDFTKNRINEVLTACKILVAEGERVVLNVQGPYTIAQALIDPRVLFKALRKDKEKLEVLLGTIEDFVVDYIREALKRGVQIISYGDSSGTLDILGPNLYGELSGKYNVNVLRRVSALIDNQILHVCGVTSAALHNGGLINSTKIVYEEELTYEEALRKAMKDKKHIKIFGHNCIKKLGVKMKCPVVWVIELK